MRLTTRAVWLAVLLGTVAASTAVAAFDANTANFKDMLITDGNGRGDRDGGPLLPGPVAQGDGIPDVFQGWMAMYDIQTLHNATVAADWNGVYADINAHMTPFVAFPELGALYSGMSSGGRQYWVSFAAAYGFTVPTGTMPTGSLGRYGAMDDPDSDGRTNLQEFQWASHQYGVGTDPALWSEAEWDAAYETLHAKGVGILPSYQVNDVMSLYAKASLDPTITPEPASLCLLGLGALALGRRRRA